jgi:hypothetical protein
MVSQGDMMEMSMVHKFNGTFNELQELIKSAGLSGKWKDRGQVNHRFRSNDGGVLSWWPSNGSIQIQGQNAARMKLENLFVARSPITLAETMHPVSVSGVECSRI